MHPGSNEEDTQIEMVEDSEIKPVHERASLMGRGDNVQRRSCVHSTCRVLMGVVATGVFVFMLIQLWAQYGDTIKTRVFSPVLVGAGSFDADGDTDTSFMIKYKDWANTTLRLNVSRPEKDLLQVTMRQPQPWSYEWKDGLLHIAMSEPTETTVFLWSV